MLIFPSLMRRALFLLFLVLPSMGFARSETGDPRFGLVLSAYRPSIDTSVRLDSAILVQGTAISLEDTAGLDDRKTLGAVSFTFNPSARWWVEASYFDLSRDGSKRLESDIDFGDETFNLDETIATRFNVDILKFGAGYQFLQVAQMSFGVTAGIHITGFDIGIEALERNAAEFAETTAPLPYAGVHITATPFERWRFGGQAEGFAISIDDIDGSLLNFTLAAEYAVTNRVNAGLGYSYYRLNVEADGFTDDLSGEIDYTYRGPLIFVRFGL